MKSLDVCMYLKISFNSFPPSLKSMYIKKSKTLLEKCCWPLIVSHLFETIYTYFDPTILQALVSCLRDKK